MYIETFDNVLTEQELILLNSRFATLEYHGETDDPEYNYINGWSAELPQDMVDFLNQKINQNIDTNDYRITRCYVNLIHNTDVFRFHTDWDGHGTARTALLYSNLTYDINDYGETLFMEGDEVKAVFPKPGKLVWFDSKIPHTARSFNKLRNDSRFTIAIKYFKDV